MTPAAEPAKAPAVASMVPGCAGAHVTAVSGLPSLYRPLGRDPEGAMPWYSILNPLPDGRRQLVVRIKCVTDATASDDLSADMFPGAEVWESTRFVATLAPRHFPRGEQGDTVVLVRPPA